MPPRHVGAHCSVRTTRACSPGGAATSTIWPAAVAHVAIVRSIPTRPSGPYHAGMQTGAMLPPAVDRARYVGEPVVAGQRRAGPAGV